MTEVNAPKIKQKMKLQDDWMLVKPYATSADKTKERTDKVGIVLPDNYQGDRERADKAIVLETSEKVKEYQAGDKVAFLRFAPIDIEIDDDKFLFVRERDVVGKIL